MAAREVLAAISPAWGRPRDGSARLVGLLGEFLNDGSITFGGRCAGRARWSRASIRLTQGRATTLDDG